MFNNISIKIIILSLFSYIIIYKVYKWTNINKEGFIPEYELDIDNNKILGWNPARGIEYRDRKNFMPRNLFRHKHLKSRMWETRFPNIINQRYSYNDKKIKGLDYNKLFPIGNKARLVELPLDLKNKQKTFNNFKTLNTPYYNLNAQKINEINSRRFQPVEPHNPNDFLPAQYADRSKSSIEMLQASDLYKERMKPVHKLLLYEE